MTLQDEIKLAFKSKSETNKFLEKYSQEPEILTQFLKFRKNGYSIFNLWSLIKDFYPLYRWLEPYFMDGREDFLIELLTEVERKKDRTSIISPYQRALYVKNREFILTFYPFVHLVKDYRSRIADFVVTGNHSDLIDLVEPGLILRGAFRHDKIQIVQSLYQQFGHQGFKILMEEKITYDSPIIQLHISASYRSLEFVWFRFPNHLNKKVVQSVLQTTFQEGSKNCYEFLLRILGPELMKKEIEKLTQQVTGNMIFKILMMKVKEFDFPTWLSNSNIVHQTLERVANNSPTEFFQKNPEKQIEYEHVFFERLLWIYLSRNKMVFPANYRLDLPEHLNQVWITYQGNPEQTLFKWNQKFDPRRRLFNLKKAIEQNEKSFASGRLQIQLKRHPKFYRWISIYFRVESEDLKDLLLLRLIPSITQDYIPDIFS